MNEDEGNIYRESIFFFLDWIIFIQQYFHRFSLILGVMFSAKIFKLHETCAVCRNCRGDSSSGRNSKGKTDNMFTKFKMNKAGFLIPWL